MKNNACPICTNVYAEFDLQKGGCDIYKCSDCNHFFVSPIPSDEYLEYLYSSKSGYHVGLGSDYANSQFNKIFQYQLKKIHSYVKTGTVLDVGCSNGEFLSHARDKGYDIQGVELNDITSTIALNNDIPVFVGKLEQAHFLSNSFDVVNLGDILEHVSDVNSFIIEVHRILKPGGITLINTPNHDAFFPKATYFLYKKFGIPWSHPTPPHHLNQFSPKSISILLNQAHLNVKEFYYFGCSLEYEIVCTHVEPKLKAAIKNKSYSNFSKLLFNALAVWISYPIIWVIDKLLFLKKQDFNMTVIAEKSLE